ncbi:hypothetical protein [Mycetocola saprophilus]|uniref:hypothetical protein n=1 Tax=Mycetocola saprophilus TaxID=76636 RepID=UPI0012DE5BC5|nr:hypothetical protein [Mycetocola saprophilus]
MTENQIGYGDYSDASAKQVGEIVEPIPGPTSIAQTVGVTVGSARDYRDTLKAVLTGLGNDVESLVASVHTFSENAVGALSAIRAADADAEQRSLESFAEMDRQPDTRAGSVVKDSSNTTESKQNAKAPAGDRKFSN